MICRILVTEKCALVAPVDSRVRRPTTMKFESSTVHTIDQSISQLLRDRRCEVDMSALDNCYFQSTSHCFLSLSINRHTLTHRKSRRPKQSIQSDRQRIMWRTNIEMKSIIRNGNWLFPSRDRTKFNLKKLIFGYKKDTFCKHHQSKKACNFYGANHKQRENWYRVPKMRKYFFFSIDRKTIREKYIIYSRLFLNFIHPRFAANLK